ncbi:Cys4 [Hyposoter didymator ichnovirus]|nr:Cys4 [Hyposoter didymator ichnovirus]
MGCNRDNFGGRGGRSCMDTVKPCCQPAVLEGFHVRHHELICFIFGQGLCQPFYDIPHIKHYVQLVKKLNRTNYMELRRAYRRHLDDDPGAELVDSRLLRMSRMSDNDVTTIFTDTRVLPSQIVRNDTTSKVTDTHRILAQKVRNDTAKKLTESNVIPVQKVRNDTATKWEDPYVIPTKKSTESAKIPVQVAGNKNITMRKIEYSSSTLAKLPVLINTFSTKIVPKAWTRYKCTGGDCDTKK